MTKKEKEDERIERTIRGLLKLPENRRCINCNSLGPQYVCTTFLTFVCTNCSGIHREFTHRVKSVSMARFSNEEVSALQAGGNERAREIYFKDWDPQRNSYPDGSNQHRLRDFIKHVYVDRKYAGQRSHEKLPRLMLGDKQESFGSQRAGSFCGCSNSLSYEGIADDKSFRFGYDERRSPRYAQENARYGGFKMTPTRFEVVDDRFRDDGIQSGRWSESNRLSNREIRFEHKSLDRQKSMDHSPNIGPIIVKPGDNAPPPQVSESPKVIDSRDADGFAHNQMITSSTTASVEGKQARKGCPSSERSIVEVKPDSNPSTEKMANDGTNCSTGESSAQENKPPPPKLTMLELLLSELTVPPVAPADNVSEGLDGDKSSLPTIEGEASNASDCKTTSTVHTPIHGISSAASSSQKLTSPTSKDSFNTTFEGGMAEGSATPAASVTQMPTSPERIEAKAVSSGDGLLVGENLPATPAESSDAVGGPAVSTENSVPAVSVSLSSEASVGQPLTLVDASLTPSTINLSSDSSNEDPPQAISNINGDSTSKILQEQQVSSTQQDLSSVTNNADNNTNEQQATTSVETKTNARKELPVDIFAVSYPAAPQTYSGFQGTSPYGMGFNMQYYPTVRPMPTYTKPVTSPNPFDINSETTLEQATQFPCIHNLQEGLPNMPSMSTMPPQASSFASAMPAAAYMAQQAHMNMIYSRPPGVGMPSGDAAYFGSLNITQQPSNEYSLPPNHFPTSKGGNPFG